MFIGMKNVSQTVVEKNETGFVRISDLSLALRFEDSLNKHHTRQSCSLHSPHSVVCFV